MGPSPPPSFCTPVYYMIAAYKSCPNGYHLTQSECDTFRIAHGAARGSTTGGSTSSWTGYPPGCWDNAPLQVAQTANPGGNVYFNTNTGGKQTNGNSRPICKGYSQSSDLVARAPVGC